MNLQILIFRCVEHYWTYYYKETIKKRRVWVCLGVCIVRWRLSVYLHMFTMYGDYLNMWLLHNIKTMQIYKFTHNPVLLLFVHEPDQVSGRFIANRLINVRIKICLIMY